MVAGKGWIALALTTFATWRPARILLGAYLFGGVTMLQFHLQGLGVQVPSPVAFSLALFGDHCGVGLDLTKSCLDSGQYARISRQTLSSQFIMLFSSNPVHPTKEIS
jgi:hypothetical protein